MEKVAKVDETKNIQENQRILKMGKKNWIVWSSVVSEDKDFENHSSEVPECKNGIEGSRDTIFLHNYFRFRKSDAVRSDLGGCTKS